MNRTAKKKLVRELPLSFVSPTGKMIPGRVQLPGQIEELQNFRSSLELIKLMDSAVQAAAPEAGYKVTDKGKENIRRIKTERRSSI